MPPNIKWKWNLFLWNWSRLNISGSYKTLPRPHFGQSDRISLPILHSYSQLIKRVKDGSEMPPPSRTTSILTSIQHINYIHYSSKCVDDKDNKIIQQPESLDDWRGEGSIQSQKSCLSVRWQGSIQHSCCFSWKVEAMKDTRVLIVFF